MERPTVFNTETNQREVIRVTLQGAAGNFILVLVKGLTGFFGHSYALMADAIESLVDVFSSILVAMGLKYAQKPPDENHPYGHGRIEPLITFIIVGFLLISATIIIMESIRHIRYPHKIPETYTLYVLAGVVILKEFFYRYISKKGKAAGSTPLQADAWHHRSDAITSLLAFAGISVALYMGEGYEAADDWAALLAALIIIFNAFLLFRPALSEMMDENQYRELILSIRNLAESVPGVVNTEKCYVRKSGMTFHVDLHLRVPGSISVTEGHDLAHLVKEKVQSGHPEIADILIHVEPA